MNKKKIKGGIQLLSKDITSTGEYKKGEIKTENNKKFKLYKNITAIYGTYVGEKFILPNDISEDSIKHIYLFGYSGEFTQQLFVRKNASNTSDKISKLLDHIVNKLKLLFTKFPSYEHLYINIILIYNEDDNCLFIIFDMSESQNKHYKKFEGLFSPAFFVSDEKLKKQINISDLKLLIDYTYKKISNATLHQKNLDLIKTKLNDKRLKEFDTGR